MCITDNTCIVQDTIYPGSMYTIHKSVIYGKKCDKKCWLLWIWWYNKTIRWIEYWQTYRKVRTQSYRVLSQSRDRGLAAALGGFRKIASCRIRKFIEAVWPCLRRAVEREFGVKPDLDLGGWIAGLAARVRYVAGWPIWDEILSSYNNTSYTK